MSSFLVWCEQAGEQSSDAHKVEAYSVSDAAEAHAIKEFRQDTFEGCTYVMRDPDGKEFDVEVSVEMEPTFYVMPPTERSKP